MNSPIAIVGMACRYPDASSVTELWENALAQRQAFRRIPAMRLNLADYFASDPLAPDCIYADTAAVIEDYEFDRVLYRISGTSYRAADMAHWVALDTAAKALGDAAFLHGDGLPRETTAVFVGNTLTGEFSRAATLRLRWPYVRRVIAESLRKENVQLDRDALLCRIENLYKLPFPEVNEETLAGSLSNTIAGRICNMFDFKGGGFTIDGACASSLLAVANACSALSAGDCDAALAGGVDLSLDPFELVGFSKTGALAAKEMRVYDLHSAGFWPGEGCGIVVLRRLEDALADGQAVYATIQGWGVSSDGNGAMTRPEMEGQLLALRRAYRRAGFGPDSIGYFEGHGTGTALGDATELRTLVRARREAGAVDAAVISSIKANIGHTKAAAGVAGLIKAVMSLKTQIRPPATACKEPHPELGEHLCVLRKPALWPDSQPLCAAVSAMGFGGINAHIVLEGTQKTRRCRLSAHEMRLANTPQDAELFLFSSQEQIAIAVQCATHLSCAEMTDLAAHLAAQPAGPLRQMIVASTPAELAERLALFPTPGRSRVSEGPRVGFLFPGQGSQNSVADTEIAQPSIVRDSVAALRALREAGVEADVAIGHSLGEITALFWAGVLDEEAAVRIATVRGRLMAQLKDPRGAMAALATSEQTARELIAAAREEVWVAGMNAPQQVVISGRVEAVDEVVANARKQSIGAIKLPVSHAFHSPWMAAAAEPLYRHLVEEPFGVSKRLVISTITGKALSEEDDLRELLRRQVTEPVLYRQALHAAGRVDVWIEVGPGRTLSKLTSESQAVQVLPLEFGKASRRVFLEAIGHLWQAGAPVAPTSLFAGRFSRPFRASHSFFVNPCELAPQDEVAVVQQPMARSEDAPAPASNEKASALAIVRELVARHLELPDTAFPDDARLLSDLHLNSIAVAHIASEAAHKLHIQAPAVPLEYAGFTVQEIADALQGSLSAPSSEEAADPPGVDVWLRTFRRHLIPRPLSRRQHAAAEGTWTLFGESAIFDGVPLPGAGVLLHLPPCRDRETVRLMLEAGKAAAQLRPPASFVLLQHGGGASFARTLRMEHPDLRVCVIDTPFSDPLMAERVLAEIEGLEDYAEAYYGEDGTRHVLVLSTVAIPAAAGDSIPAGVLLVSGGGKGIGAECAIAAARLGAVRLAIFGSSPAQDNPALERMRALNIDFTYVQVDLTSRAAVANAVAEVRLSVGPITGVIHCAGLNQPRRIESMTEEEFAQTVDVKAGGLQNILAAVAGDPVRLLIGFGSIIQQMGVPGEAHYAVANEWMSAEVNGWSASHPECKCLVLEWSVWAGTGMGERLGVLDTLRRSGVSTISIDEGVRLFRQIVLAGLSGSVIVAGRFGTPPTLEFEHSELPLLRFLERLRVYYPGVELITDVALSVESDPYLNDHVFSGGPLFPGVMALEAIAQSAMALMGSTSPPRFESVFFARSLPTPSDHAITLRVASLARADDLVEVSLRSSETQYQVDHIRALCRLNAAPPANKLEVSWDEICPPIDPNRDLYQSLLFQRGRFRRISGYRKLSATECVAEVASAEPRGWFNRYLPQNLVLGDPGVRDAAIHAIQACIPHATVLPTSVGTIHMQPHIRCASYLVTARERQSWPDRFLYELEIATPDHRIVERWEDLELHIIRRDNSPSDWPAALLAPYFERRIAESHNAGSISVSWESDEQSVGANRTLERPLTTPGGRYHSRSHARHLTLNVTANVPVGCDCEPIVNRNATIWKDLLGEDGYSLACLISRENKEAFDCAATRVWSSIECVKKAGLRPGTGLLLSPQTASASEDHDGWVRLTAGQEPILTWVGPVRDLGTKLAFAVLVGS